MSLMINVGKKETEGKCVWSNRRKKNHASVWVDRHGGATYRYTADRTDGAPQCRFSLFSEVGEPYQPRFAAFWRAWERIRSVEYENHPYVADLVRKIKP